MLIPQFHQPWSVSIKVKPQKRSATMPANLSIRNARFEYRSRFTQAITDYRAVCDLYAHARVPEEISQTLLSRLPADVLRRVVRHLVGSLSQADALLGIASPLRPPPAVKFEVCVRVRPLWSTEAEDGEYDAISIDEDVGRCCVHDGKAARDMSTYTLHREFALDRTFGANTDEGAMHSQVVGPLLQRVLQGGRATLILFGKTGTGKTCAACLRPLPLRAHSSRDRDPPPQFFFAILVIAFPQYPEGTHLPPQSHSASRTALPRAAALCHERCHSTHEPRQ